MHTSRKLEICSRRTQQLKLCVRSQQRRCLFWLFAQAAGQNGFKGSSSQTCFPQKREVVM